MPPFVITALTTGLLIAVVDTAAILAPGSLGLSRDVVEIIDWIANVALYSYLGLRVGRATGVIRDAAEAGVIAALVAATVAVGVSAALGAAPESGSRAESVIAIYAMNVAMGGILALVNGWLGSKAQEGGSARRP